MIRAEATHCGLVWEFDYDEGHPGGWIDPPGGVTVEDMRLFTIDSWDDGLADMVEEELGLSVLRIARALDERGRAPRCLMRWLADRLRAPAEEAIANGDVRVTAW